jgi:alpha-beta hydrolase superfamily lysophospholipase
MKDYAQRSNDRDYDWYALDFPGHGFSQGIRDLVNISEYLDTYKQFIQLVMAQYYDSGKCFFISGLSMGGGLSILLGLEYQVKPLEKYPMKGVVLMAPAIHNSVAPPAFVTWILRNLVLKCCPMNRVIGMPTLNPEQISRKKERQKEISEDDLISGKAMRLLLMTAEVSRRIPEITYPFYVIHGDNDLIIPISGSIELMEKSSTPTNMKVMKTIPGGYHDVYSELESMNELETIFQFYDSKLE